MAETRRRVKLYALNADRQWDDRGTGHVSSSYVDRLKGMSLLVRAELDGESGVNIDHINFIYLRQTISVERRNLFLSLFIQDLYYWSLEFYPIQLTKSNKYAYSSYYISPLLSQVKVFRLKRNNTTGQYLVICCGIL